MEDVLYCVELPRSRIAALQAAAQNYLKDPRNEHSPIRAEVADGLELLDLGFKV